MTQQMDAARFLEDFGRANPQVDNIDLRYGTYWTGVIDIMWHRRTFTPPGGYEPRRSELNPNWNDGHPSDGDRSASPLVTSSSIPSVVPTTSGAPQVAVEELFVLPSRPRITTVMNLHLGRMVVTEQRRAVVLPEQRLSSETKNGTPGLRWVAGGISWAWRLVGRVGRMIDEGIGSIQRG